MIVFGCVTEGNLKASAKCEITRESAISGRTVAESVVIPQGSGEDRFGYPKSMVGVWSQKKRSFTIERWAKDADHGETMLAKGFDRGTMTLT